MAGGEGGGEGTEENVPVRRVPRQREEDVKVPPARLARDAKQDVPRRARKPQPPQLLVEELLVRWRIHPQLRHRGRPLRRTPAHPQANGRPRRPGPQDPLEAPHRPNEQGVHVDVVPGADARLERIARCLRVEAEDELEKLRRVVGLGDVEGADVRRMGVRGREARGDG